MRYHAARGLIYLGCLDVGGVYLFKRVPGTTDQHQNLLVGISCRIPFFPEIPAEVLMAMLHIATPF